MPLPSQKKTEMHFLLALLAIVGVLVFFILRPFFYALVLAVVFGTVFYPLHKKILTLMGNHRGVASLLSTLSVFLIVVIPIGLLGTLIFQEATQLYFFLVSNEGATILTSGVEGTLQSVERYFHIPVDFSLDINQYAKEGLSRLIPHLGSFASNAAKATVSVLIFLVALYYVFKDGERLKAALVKASPLQDKYNHAIFTKLGQAINSVTMGSLAVSVVQGLLSAIGFLIFGVPSPMFWGSVTAVAAMIPGLGTTLVVGPAIVYLFLSGHTIPAVCLLIWGATAVGLIDNFLGPKLVGRGVAIHPFLILLSILGGIGVFGPLGFLLGPLVLSLLFALLDIYFTLRKE